MVRLPSGTIVVGVPDESTLADAVGRSTLVIPASSDYIRQRMCMLLERISGLELQSLGDLLRCLAGIRCDGNSIVVHSGGTRVNSGYFFSSELAQSVVAALQAFGLYLQQLAGQALGQEIDLATFCGPIVFKA